MKPGVQYPHCEPPRSAISRWTGCSRPGRPRPSAVTTSCWSNAAAGTRQALIATQPVRPVVPGDEHRAGAALALGATLLAAGQPAAAQPLQQGDVTADLAELTSPAVDH